MQKNTQKIRIIDSLHSLPFSLIIFDDKLKIEFINQVGVSYLASLGYTNNINKSDLEKYDVFSSSLIFSRIKKILNGVAFEELIASSKTLTGNDIKLIMKGAPLFINNEIYGGIIIIEDFHSPTSQNSKYLTPNKQPSDDYIKYFSDYSILTNIDGVILNSFENPLVDKSFKILFENKKSFFDYLPTEVKESIKNEFLKTVQNQKIYSRSILFENEALNNPTINFKFIPLVNHLNQINTVVIAIDDATEKTNSIVQPIVDEIKSYNILLENLSDGFIIIDKEGCINYWNEKSSQLFGYKQIEVYGKFIGRVIPDINKNLFLLIIEEIENQGQYHLDTKIINDKLDINLKIRKKDENNFLVIIENITERKNKEKLLRTSEEQFRNLVTNSRELICIINEYGFVVYANPGFKEFFAYTTEELNKVNIIDLVDYDKYLQTFSLDMFIELKQLEIPLINKYKKTSYFQASIENNNKLDNKSNLYNLILTDISERKKLEENLIFTKAVFETTLDGIAVYYQRKLILANGSFCRIFEYLNLDEIQGRDPLDFIANDDIPPIANLVKLLEKNEKVINNYNVVGLTKKNKEKYLLISAYSYIADSKLYIVKNYKDITAQKEIQEALKNSEERYRNITENINEFIWSSELHKNKMNTVLLTKAIEPITGYTVEELTRDNLNWFRFIHPNDYPDVIKRIKKLFLNHKKNSDEIECRIITKEGSTKWVQNKITIERDSTNKIIKLFGIGSDISIKKKAEEDLRKSAENLQLLNTTKDKFLSIISHDLRTPFSSILGFTDLLLADDLTREKQIEYINFIKESSQNMLELVNSLLDWTRLQTGRFNFIPANMNISNSVKKVMQMIQGVAIQKNIQLKNNLPNEIIIYADESLIFQLFNNLISNAIKFTNSGGLIEVNMELSTKRTEIIFIVKDNGVGIKEENLSKLFKIDSKFTLKGTAGEKGSGLGLSLCQEIIEKHNGSIWVESVFGKGTEFKFALPISSNNILLVDPYKSDLILYTKLLKSLIPEYNILTTSDVNDAIELIETQQPTLVISENIINEIKGSDFIKKILFSDIKKKPSFIILSRELNENILDEYKQIGIEHIYHKPVNINVLKSAIIQTFKNSLFSTS